MLVIDAAAVRELFPMRAAIEQMREALERYSAATIVQPLRTVVRPSRAPGMMAAMPAWAGPDRGFGIKTVTIHPGNPARGLDTHQGTVTMFDRETGVPTAVLDAAAITEIRTAAVSAVATQALAAPDARDLAIVGAGTEARTSTRSAPASPMSASCRPTRSPPPRCSPTAASRRLRRPATW